MTKDIQAPTTGGSATPGEPPTPPSTPSPRQCMVAHACPACTYTHRVALDADPVPSARYSYPCPTTGKQVTFAGSEVMRVFGPAPVAAVHARRIAEA